MAHSHRVIFAALLALLLLALSMPGHASFAAPPGITQYAVTAWPGIANNWGESKGSVCSLAAAFGGYGSGSINGSNNMQCDLYDLPSSPGYKGSVGLTSRVLASACPSNSSGTTTCTCNAPTYVEAGTTPQSCISVEAVACGSLAGSKVWLTTTGKANIGSNTCAESGCNAKWDGTILYVTDKTTGVVTTEGAGTYGPSAVGMSPECSYNAANPTTNAAKDPCPTGAAGTINGLAVCVPYDTERNTIESIKSTTSGETVTQSTASGTVTSTTTTNGNTTSQTQCSGGGCTTLHTTTTTNPDGTKTTSTKVDTDSTEGFCTKNPSSPICKEATKGTFTGSCEAEFQCTGDAAMCAIARAASHTRCSLDAKLATQEISAYDSAKTAGTVSGVQTTSVGISSASFDQTNALGVSASCIADFSITISKKTFMVPIGTSVCPNLGKLGQLLMAISFLSSIVIVGKPT